MSIDSIVVAVCTLLVVVTIIIVAVLLARPLRAYRKESLSLWEVTMGYNQENIHKGRELSNRILAETNSVGLPTFQAYTAYFSADLARAEEKRYLHDLVSYYHHLGLLIWKGDIDAESVFLLIGPGFLDRWNVIKPFGTFYASSGDTPEAYIHYGGIYLFYDAYKNWKTSTAPLQHAIRAAYRKSTQEVS